MLDLSILQPTKKEINESIEDLRRYKERLKSEIIKMSQKLRISKAKMQSILDESLEIQNIDNAIKRLSNQIKT